MTTRYTSVYTKIVRYSFILICTVLFIIPTSVSFAQCAVPTVGCTNTNLANYGSNSNTNAAAIEYDNFVSSYHSTVARTGDGSLQLWEKIWQMTESIIYFLQQFSIILIIQL